MDICCGKFFVDCKSEVWPHKHFYLAFILTRMTTKESPETGVWNIACRQMMNTPTICVQNTAYISTIIKLKMVQTFKAISDKFNLQAPGILYIGQAYCHSPANPFYIFSQQIYLMIFFILAHTISVYSSSSCVA